MRDLLLKLIRRQDLTRDETRHAFGRIFAGDAGDARTAALVMGLAVKGVSGDELAAAAGVMRDAGVAIPRREGETLLDTCGTGGDVSGTFNVSTAAALLTAACGVKVVKHGGRSVSGKTGSADVLEALGVRLDSPADRLRACLDEAGICFAFAQSHHPAMRHAAGVRAALGVPTIFNLLGPLTNPARACHQLLGVYDRPLARLLAGVLLGTGTKRAWVVHADDGLDELSTLGPTFVCEVVDDGIKEWTLDPSSLGLPRPSPDDLRAGSPAESAAVIRRVVAGEPGPAYDIAALNAAAGLVITGHAAGLDEGLGKVAAAVRDGNARRTLATLSSFA